MRFLALILVLSCAVAPSPAARSGDELAARSPAGNLPMEDLEDLLLLRHSFAPDGRDLLRHLVQTRVIEHLGEAGGVEVSPRDVNQLWDEIDRRAKAEGVPGGIAAELKRKGMSAAELRELLRLSVIQQVLTRRALGLAADAQVSGEQMAIWIDQEITQRGLETLSPPWKDGVIAVCGEVTVPLRDFSALLARHLPSSKVREACFHLLLLRGIEARMPDVSEEAKSRAIDAEIDRRRREVEGEASYKGLSFESLLNAQGLTVDVLRQDPSVGIAALSTLWVDRAHGEAGLREVFEEERKWFEDRFGEAVRTHAIFLRGAKFKNQWNPRSFEEAERELRSMAGRVGSFADFTALARTVSEDPRTKALDGDLGWITRGDENQPSSIREAIFTHLATGGKIPKGGVLHGPVRLENGAALLYLSERRESPGWDAMSGHVHHELRRRFLREVLKEEEVTTFLDG